MSSSTEIESPVRDLDRRAWLRIEREKARKELRLDQDGDVTETTTASELTSYDSLTPKRASPLRTSSYSMALNIPAPSVDSPRRRDGKLRRGRRSQVRETIADDVATKEEDASLSSPSRGEFRQSEGNHAEALSISPDDSECVNTSVVSSPRRPRRRSVGPGHREKKDSTTSSHISCETPLRRPRRRSLGPSRRPLLRPLDLTTSGDDAPGHATNSSRPSHHTSHFDLPDDDDDAPPTTQRRSRHPSSSRHMSELSDELSPPASPRRRLQTRKVKKINYL